MLRWDFWQPLTTSGPPVLRETKLQSTPAVLSTLRFCFAMVNRYTKDCSKPIRMKNKTPITVSPSDMAVTMTPCPARLQHFQHCWPRSQSGAYLFLRSAGQPPHQQSHPGSTTGSTRLGLEASPGQLMAETCGTIVTSLPTHV